MDDLLPRLDSVINDLRRVIARLSVIRERSHLDVCDELDDLTAIRSRLESAYDRELNREYKTAD